MARTADPPSARISASRGASSVSAASTSAAAPPFCKITGTPMRRSPRARASFPNPNHFAGYLEVALCLAIGAMIADRARSASEPGGNGFQMSFSAGIMDIITGPLARLRLVIVIMVIALGRGLVTQVRTRSFSRPQISDWQSYLACWTLAPLLFFTFSGNILWTYVISGIPAFALLMASGAGQQDHGS